MLSIPFSPYRLSKTWFILACGLAFLFLLFAPGTPHGENTRHALGTAFKKVKDTASAATGGQRWDEDDMMREWELRRALQHEGTGARIQAFLDKARSGQPYTVSVIGGSVSKGRGLTPPAALRRRDDDASSPVSAPDSKTEDNIDITEAPPPSHPIAPLSHLGASTLYSPDNLHVLIFDWLNETFPHPENRFVNGAQGGVGAGYFGWCFKEHIPEDSDLVLLELGINDLLEFEVVGAYEHLVRGVLELGSRPAIINIETFTTLFPSLVSSSTFHSDVLSFYDVPSIAVRDVLIPRILADPEKQMPRWFRTGDDVAMGDPKVREWGGVAVDVMHISGLGHGLAAGLVIRYLQDQIERSTPSQLSALGRFASGSLRRPTLRILDVPATSLTGQFNPSQRDMKHAPVCRSENSGILHGAVSTLEDNFEQGEFRGLVLADGSSGWTQWSWKEKRYLIAREPGSTANFDFVVSPPQAADVSDDTSALLLGEANDDDEDAGDEFGESLEDAQTSDTSRNKFEPLPIAMRPGGPYNPDSKESDYRHHSTRSPPHAHAQARTRRFLTAPNERQASDAGGSVFIGYQRSAKLGLGSVWCWVDDERMRGTQVDGWWKLDKRNMGMVKEIASGLEPGTHTLHCEVLKETLDPTGGTEFRLFAVMHD
ncbi:hypothetical protein IAT38_001117 [Cryptococcus sp. DSM 104549]